VGAYTNLRRVASRSIRRLGDAAFRRRLMNMHRAMAAMGQGTLSGYLGTSRMLWRAIAADGMIHPDECLLLMGLASQVRVGGRFGPQDKTAFQRNIARSRLSRLIHLISATSEAAAESWSLEIGLLWIDGDHRYQAVKKDFELWSPFLHTDGRIAFDDSTVVGLGPHTLIKEILSAGSFTTVQTVGKITVLEPSRTIIRETPSR
jgi:hypothetical protein